MPPLAIIATTNSPAFRRYCRRYRLSPELFRQRLREFETSQFLDADVLRRRQTELLREAIEFAVANVPYYRELAATRRAEPAEFADAGRYQEWPVLTREKLQAAGIRLHAETPANGVTISSSSGTSGRPVVTRHDAATRHTLHAARARALSWYDAAPWDRVAMLVSQRLGVLRRTLSHIADRFAGRRRNGTFSLTQREAGDVLRRFARLRAPMLLAQPSLLHRLIWFANHARVDLREWNTRVVLSNSELLTPSIDCEANAAFGCPVLNEYGCTEVGSLAHRCPQGGLHLNPEHVLVEIVDDQGWHVPPGFPGQVVLTSLRNRVMPLLRYAVGDAAVWSDGPCTCGRQRGLPLVRSVEGRLSNVWRDRSGQLIAAMGAVAEWQARLHGEGYVESQFVRRGAATVELRLEPARAPSAETTAWLRERLTDLLGGPVEVVFEGRVPLRSGSGKLSPILQN